MIYFVYFLIFFSLVQFFSALINVIFYQKFRKYKDPIFPLVSILIPARNEEKNISNLLTDLQAQNYKNIEVIVFNDQSEDRTKEIIEKYALKNKRIKLINSTDLPNGWLGKNNACYNLARNANGEYFLFIDADVRIGKNIIFNTINYSKFHNIELLSIFPKQIMKTTGEWATVPIMHYILLSLLPLIFVRKSIFTSHSAANGQFMLFKAKTYNIIQPHQLFKNEKVEDIKISRYYKKNKYTIACLSAKQGISCRMYNSYNQAIEGFSKNIKMFFGNSFVVAIIFWFVTTFGLFFTIIFASKYLFFLHLLLILSTKIFTSISAKQNIFKNLIFFIPQQLTMGYIILKSFNKQKVWKGRNI